MWFIMIMDFFSPCDKVNFILEACKKMDEWINE